MPNENNKENKDILGKNDAQNATETTGKSDNGTVTPNKTTETTTSTEEVKPENIVEGISNKLSSDSAEEAKEHISQPKDTNPFDPSTLTQEQLQSLKTFLDATPDSPIRKKDNPRVTLRRIDGKFVVDFKKAFNTPIKDLELNREVERHVIPVLLRGEKEYKNILYSVFINSERVSCEAIKHTQEKKEFIEGQTISRETGRPAQLIRTEVVHKFVVRLPDNEGELEIEGKMANA